MKHTRLFLACVLVSGVAASAIAQRPNRQMGGRQTPPPGRQDPRRAQLEGDIRRGFARAVRERVGLTDEQMQKLGPMTQRYEDQRRVLFAEERLARVSLQTMLRDEATADATKVTELLDKLSIELPRRRLQLMEAEQRDLATIMNPVQRAKFLGLQEQIRRRLEEMRPMGPPDGQFGEPQPPDSQSVRLSVEPLRAEILVNGRLRAAGRLATYLPAGSHEIEFRAIGCTTMRETITVERGQPVVVPRKTLTCQP